MICCDCKHWRFDPGCPDWSDVTPGENFKTYCDKHKWYLEAPDATSSQFRAYLKKAESCDLFEDLGASMADGDGT